jgi:hypothetical protein
VLNGGGYPKNSILPEQAIDVGLCRCFVVIDVDVVICCTLIHILFSMADKHSERGSFREDKKRWLPEAVMSAKSLRSLVMFQRQALPRL